MIFDPIHILMLTMATGLAGSLLVIPFSSHKKAAGWANLVFTIISSGLALIAVTMTLTSGQTTSVILLNNGLLNGQLKFSMDSLSAVFVGIIAIISFLSALYSVNYMDHYKEYSASGYYPAFQLFVAGMFGIVTVTDLFLNFGIIWQVMTISSFFLIRYEYKKKENVRAAWVYLVMMELACAAIMTAGWLISGGNSTPLSATRFDFDSMAGSLIATAGYSSPVLIISLALFFLGFAVKSGLWPFGQIWLPDAHPAAPSPVSALLSGVMIKTGVYGILRIFFWLLPIPYADPAGHIWGIIIAVIGTITLFTGTVQALNQEETKRLLAYHSIGQVGYIMLGIGACLVLTGRVSSSDLAFVALFSALFHTVNHALFKSLLFLNAGTILKATDTQDLNKLGGLIKFMPLTGITALIASFSIAGVPLLNGFVSKWALYVSTILGGSPVLTDGTTGFLTVCGFIALLTSVITLASFIKFFGVSFLSRVSRTVDERSKTGGMEADVLMQTSQVILAGACVFLGIFPVFALKVFEKIPPVPSASSAIISGLTTPIQSKSGLFAGLSWNWNASVYSPLLILVIITMFILFAALIYSLGASKKRQAEPWLCGYDTEGEHNRYKAHNLYHEVKHYLSWISGKKKAHGQKDQNVSK